MVLQLRSPSFPHLSWTVRLLAGLSVVAAAVVALVVLLAGTGSSGPRASRLPRLANPVGPESIFTAGTQIMADPVGSLNLIKSLGADRVRVFLTWDHIAPDAASVRPPAGFDASDPSAYPAAGWGIYDTMIRDIIGRGMGVDVLVGPPPPRWAEGAGAPDPAIHTYWRPSVSAFQDFVRAAGIRYSGHYVPPGASKPLPRVDFWSIWNEPNLGVQLAPQAIDHSTVEASALMYRGLGDAAWTALQATGHGHDTILIGELAPAGATFAGAPGDFAAMAPLRFLRALYCVGADYRPLRGAAATVRGCPTTHAGSVRFRTEHPALFQATGVADHPYPQGLPPNVPTPGEPDFAELAGIQNLIRALDTLQHVYGSDTRFPIYSTEFGYLTSPPDVQTGTVSPALGAEYINWSEYLTWRQPRLACYDQYLLDDPTPHPGPYEGFASGLFTYLGQPKPGLAAYRMPLFLPVTSTAAGHPLEVWGCVRPAPDAQRQTHHAQRVQIQFRAASGGSFTTVRTVTLTNRHGYFDVLERFPASGSVRLTWSYPQGPAVHSRTVDVTVG